MRRKFLMRIFGGCLLSLALAGTPPRAEAAQTEAALRVERNAGAEDCPDVTVLAAKIDAIRGADASPATTSYRVIFSHDGPAYSATIRAGAGESGLRVMEDRGSSCAALARATAVTLALLFDSHVALVDDSKRAGEGAPSVPVKAAPPPSAAVDLPRPAKVRDRGATTLAVGAAGLGLVLRPLVPAIAAEGGIEVARWRMGIGVLGTLPQTIELGPGTVHESLLSGTVRACYAVERGQRLRFDLCGGAFAGVLSAEARGYTRNGYRKGPWFVLPLEVVLADLAGSIGWEVTASELLARIWEAF
jgi:hypothetical protein